MMQEIVINKCHGGFGLSKDATLALASRKGIKVWGRETEFGNDEFWTIPPSEQPPFVSITEREERPEEYATYIEARKKHGWWLYDLSDEDGFRSDPDLVATIKEYGDAANSRFAALSVVEIPDGVEYSIEEYDGLEWVAEKHRTWG
ncbi:hypothetical protein [Parasphingopyxis sp.]|uniref:hypothetical protein n=1 Tax=Parasphingopyxis sp. TaxID=1920299 RepID=UPI00262EC932|nr:hypothetical protein [Parasphingopyxis sp.]